MIMTLKAPLCTMCLIIKTLTPVREILKVVEKRFPMMLVFVYVYYTVCACFSKGSNGS